MTYERRRLSRWAALRTRALGAAGNQPQFTIRPPTVEPLSEFGAGQGLVDVVALPDLAAEFAQLVPLAAILYALSADPQVAVGATRGAASDQCTPIGVVVSCEPGPAGPVARASSAGMIVPTGVERSI